MDVYIRRDAVLATIEHNDKVRELMCKQITAMRSYVDILQQRISYDIQYYSK